jgi:hypothetical protein
MRRQLFARVLSFTACFLAACGESTPNDPSAGTQPVEIRVELEALTLDQRDSVRITPVFLDATGDPVVGVVATFATMDAAVATVRGDGMVTSVGPAGLATIKIGGAGLSKNVAVTVVPTPTSITVSPPVVELSQLRTARITARVVDAVGGDIRDASVTWMSANPGLFAVTAAGDISSRGPAGQALVLASAGRSTATALVVVRATPTRIVGLPTSLVMAAGQQASLKPVIRDAIDLPIDDAVVTYRSTNSSVVTVSSAGVIAALGTIGTAEIVLAVGTLTARVPVSVITATHPAGIVGDSIFTDGSVFGVAISNDNVLYATGFGRRPLRVDLPATTARSNILPLPTSSFAVAFDATGRRAYFAGSGTTLMVAVDVATNTVLWTIERETDTPIDIVLSRDERMAFVATLDGRIHAIDIAARSIAWELAIGGLPAHLAVHPTLPSLYVSGSIDDNVVEVNLETHLLRNLIPVGPKAQDIVVSPDGSELWVARESGSLELIRLDNGTRSTITFSKCAAYGLSLSPDGEQLYVACGFDGLVIVDRARRTTLKQIPLSGRVRRVAFHPKGFVAAGSVESPPQPRPTMATTRVTIERRIGTQYIVR